MKLTIKDERIKEILKTAADILNDNWLAKTLLTTLPSLVTSIVLQGINQKYYLSNGNWNISGWIGVTIVVLFTVGVNALLAYKTACDRKNEIDEKIQLEAYIAEVELRQHITSAECITEDRKNRHLRDWIAKNPPSDDVKDYVSHARDSQERFGSLLDALRECLSIISEIPTNQINLSAVICIGEGKQAKDWSWITPSKLEGTPDLEELLMNDSALLQVVNGKPFYVKRRKDCDEDGKPYYKDKLDETFGNKGSIVCIGYDEKIRKTKIRTVISISTYGRELIEDDDKTDDDIMQLYEEVLRKTILLQFEGEIKEELLWYGLQKMRFPIDQSTTPPHPRNKEIERAREIERTQKM